MTLSQDEIRTIASSCYADPVLFCKTFLAHWFPGDIPWVHRGILAILTRKTDFLLTYGELDKIEKNFIYKVNPEREDSPTKPLFILHRNEEGEVVKVDLVLSKFSLIMMPRGTSKTTLNNAVTLYFVVYQECEFPLYVSETGKHAAMQLGNVKRELESNDRLIAVFGNKVPGRQDAQKWTEDMITTLDGITVVARGRGGQVRGLNFDGRRPDRIIVDDLEDKEAVSTADQREKTRIWFWGDLYPALAKMKEDAGFVVIGTLLHEDALMMRLMQDSKFTSVRFGALDADGEPLWPMYMDHGALESEKQSYALAGRLAEFHMEYMSICKDESSASFKRSFLRYEHGMEYVAKAIVIDPAISDKISADDCVIAVVGMTVKGKLGVIDVWGKRGASPREQVDMYFQMVMEHSPTLFGVESVAYQAALVHLLREEMFRRGKYFEIAEIKHRAKKAERILGVLQPRYAAGYISHERIFPKLEQQLLDFDGKGHDDYPDAVAMAITLLDPYAAQAADPNKDLADDEYEPIEELIDGTYYHAP